jgi:CheY-like chemotaxis protein
MNNHLEGGISVDFLSRAAHELRNPLATALVQAELLLDGIHGPLSTAQSAALRSIHDHTRQTAALISELVDVARVQTESLTLTTCDPSEAAEFALSQKSELATTRSIHISRTFSTGLKARADKIRLTQMIGELLAAAILVTPTGGQTSLHITAEAGSILIQAIGNATLPLPLAQDTPPAMLQQLNGLKPIGLALLEALTRLHQGRFTIRAAAGHASIFVLELPVVSDSAAQEALSTQIYSPASLPHPTSNSAHPQVILIADDQTAFVSVTSGYLESLGFQVASACDGEEAVRLTSTLLPDLIFMDVCMPVLDGLSAIREIRASKSPKLQTIPIISLSGGTSAADREKCLAAGATSYLGKPFGIREIDNILHEFLPAVSP